MTQRKRRQPTDQYNSHALPEGHRLQVHEYELQSILGQDGLTITYIAQDIHRDQTVAIKEYLPRRFVLRADDGIVRPTTREHEEFYFWGLNRFLIEAQTLARFDHPNIVQVVNVFEENNTAYMVTAYEQGENLAAKLGRGELKREVDLLRIFLPVLDGLALTHGAGCIHGDIKPVTILIREDSSPVLLHFGSARQAMERRAATTTRPIPHGYTPLEQYYEDSGRQGPWSDIYGLGATLYETVTGVLPADAPLRASASIAHRPDPYVPAEGLGAGRYSTHFLVAIDWALRLREVDRPQTAAEWARALKGDSSVPLVQAGVGDQSSVDEIPTQINEQQPLHNAVGFGVSDPAPRRLSERVTAEVRQAPKAIAGTKFRASVAAPVGSAEATQAPNEGSAARKFINKRPGANRSSVEPGSWESDLIPPLDYESTRLRDPAKVAVHPAKAAAQTTVRFPRDRAVRGAASSSEAKPMPGESSAATAEFETRRRETPRRRPTLLIQISVIVCLVSIAIIGVFVFRPSMLRVTAPAAPLSDISEDHLSEDKTVAPIPPDSEHTQGGQPSIYRNPLVSLLGEADSVVEESTADHSGIESSSRWTAQDQVSDQEAISPPVEPLPEARSDPKVSGEFNPNPVDTSLEQGASDPPIRKERDTANPISAKEEHSTTNNDGDNRTYTNQQNQPIALQGKAMSPRPAEQNARPMPSTALAPAVARAQFTRGIEAREPINRVESVVHADGQQLIRLFYFTDLRNLRGETVTHRWEHKGQPAAEVHFQIGGNRWRIYSSKNLTPSMVGQWRVVVTDSRGNQLKTDTINYRTSTDEAQLSSFPP
jgi:serine/threonine protein kinase